MIIAKISVAQTNISQPVQPLSGHASGQLGQKNSAQDEQQIELKYARFTYRSTLCPTNVAGAK